MSSFPPVPARLTRFESFWDYVDTVAASEVDLSPAETYLQDRNIAYSPASRHNIISRALQYGWRPPLI